MNYSYGVKRKFEEIQNGSPLPTPQQRQPINQYQYNPNNPYDPQNNPFNNNAIANASFQMQQFQNVNPYSNNNKQLKVDMVSASQPINSYTSNSLNNNSIAIKNLQIKQCQNNVQNNVPYSSNSIANQSLQIKQFQNNVQNNIPYNNNTPLKGRPPLNNNPDKNAKEEYKCQFCEYTTDHKGNLRSHISHIHDKVKIRSFPGQECDIAVSYTDASAVSELKSHIFQDHRKKRIFKCNRCDFSSCQHNSVKSHVTGFHSIQRSLEILECIVSIQI